MSEDNPLQIASDANSVELGRTTERATIVAWLRTHDGDHARVYADAIEAGVHWAELNR